MNTLRSALLVALAVLLAGFGWWARGIVAQRDEAAHATQHAQAMRALADAATAASERARQAEQAAAGRIQEVATHAHAQQEAARRDAATADRTAEQLRRHVARLAAQCAGSAAPVDPAASAPGSPATGPGLVLADMLFRLEGRGRELAAYADQARAAGIACQRSYDALR